MAKKPAKIAVTLDAARVAEIAQSMFNACNPLRGALDEVNAAKDGVTTAQEGEGSQRESILCEVAALSSAGSWSVEEVQAATPIAVKKINNDDRSAKTLATFISETRRVAHPMVRDIMPMLVSIRDAAWDKETEQKGLNPDSPTPIRKAFKRRYHFLLTGLCGATAAGVSITTVEDAVAYARAKDPDHDAAAVLKRLTKLKEDLLSFYSDFPVDDIKAAADTLDDVAEEHLTAARMRRLADAAAMLPDPATAPIPSAALKPLVGQPVTQPAAILTTVGGTDHTLTETEEQEVNSELAPGAVDVFEDFLAGNSAAA